MRKRLSAGLSLNLFLVGSVIVSGVLALVAMTWQTGSAVRQHLSEELGDQSKSLARSVARNTSFFLESHFGALAALAAEPDERSLGTLASAFPAFSTLLVVDSTGKVRLSHGGDNEEGYDVSRREYYLGPVKSGQSYLSDSSISRRSYHPTVYLSQRVPQGIVAGELDLQSLSVYIAQLALKSEDLAAIADGRGTLVAHSDGSRVERSENLAWPPELKAAMFREDSAPKEMDFEGQRVLLSAAPVPGTRWMAIVAIPTAEGEHSVSRLRYSLLFAMSLIIALILGTSIVGLFYLASEFRGFAARMHAIASGDYELLPHEPVFSEFRSLARDFEHMAQKVKTRETGLSESLEHKEALIQEVHHRVKNNMQMVVSLLSLGQQQIDDPLARVHFERAIGRIDAMATVHEMLYYSGNLARLRFDDYLRSLALALVDPSCLRIESEVLVLDMDRAIPGGLIANELITNAIKHSGKDRAVEIRLCLAIEGRPEEGMAMARLEVADNGRGFEEGLDPEHSGTLGLRLVLSLIQQLRGSWELSNDCGAHWTIRFPL